MFNLLTPKQAFLDAQGNPLSGGRLWTKVSGSNTNKATTRDINGTLNTNPIILDSRGEVPFAVFGTTGAYRLILAAPGDLTDPPTSPIWGPIDGVSGINDFVSTSDEWNPTGLSPTFISLTSFSVPGDQTLIFEPRRRCRATVGAGFRYTTIQSSVFSTVTTVTLALDINGAGLDGSISAVAVGKVTATNTSQPYDSARGLDIASSGTITLQANADRFNITGVNTITAFANSWVGRRVYITHAAAQPLTHSANFILLGAASFTTSAGDESVWEQTTSAPIWKMINYQSALSTMAGLVLLSKNLFTVSGTWTRPNGCTAIEVETVGGGGGGGGASSNSTILGSSGAGGGGGGRTVAFILTGFAATEAVTIAAGGAGGTATPGQGGTGGTTSFGALTVAQGGQGGNVNTGAGVSVGATAGGSAGIGVAYSNTSGSPGAPGLVFLNAAGNAAVAVGGNGGSSPEGGAALGPVTIGAASIAGSAGVRMGGGGSGACVIGVGSAVGGAGAAGGCIVYEYGKA